MKAIFKVLLSYLPFKKFIYKLLRSFYSPSQKLYRHLYFTGEFKVRINEKQSFKIVHYGYSLENEIFWKGLEDGWEKNSMEIWKKLSANSSTIMDIGANTGVFALVARTLNPSAKIYAFEPVKRVYDKLLKNVELNNFDIKCFELAISNKDGIAKIYDPGGAHVYSVSVNRNLEKDDKKINEVEINTKRLSTLVKMEKIERIDLLKIDVEQHEPEVLEGYGDLLAFHKPSMLIEILTEEVAKNVESQLRGLNYLFFNINENTGPKQVSTITKSDSFNYLVCQRNVAQMLDLIE